MREGFQKKWWENLVVEEVPLFQPLWFGVDMKLSPLIYIPDLEEKIFHLPEQNLKYTIILLTF